MLLRTLSDHASASVEAQLSCDPRWGRESCVMLRRARRAELGSRIHTLSVHAAWGGTEICRVGGREIGVDDDNFLILNHGQIYSTSIRSLQPVESLAICFKPELAEQVYGEVSASIEQALARGDAPGERTPDFMENLNPHENSVSPVLRFIRAHASRGVTDESWYDEQLVFLLARMQCHHRRLLEQVERIALIRPATRREVHRRISLATDFLHTNYSQDVDLSTLAKMAYLSKYHFLRLFTLVHGVTPRTYLQHKRIGVAIRLLESTRMTMSEVSASVGFAEESTLVRQMRRWTKLTPRQVRQRVMAGHAA